MTTPINTSGSKVSEAIAPQTTTPKTNGLDRDAFLKLLVAQLSHQDPLQPVQGTEYVTQLAQFTAVEQSMAQSGKLDVLSTQLGGIASNEAVSLIGKDVTVRGKNVKAADNSAVDPTKDQKGTVVGISYDKGYAELTLSSGVTAPLSDLVGVNAPPAK